jgi:hypothetical protein
MGGEKITKFALHERQNAEAMFIFNRSQNLTHIKFGKFHLPKVNTLMFDINNHMCFKWLHYLPSFFKISETLWIMVVLNKEI